MSETFNLDFYKKPQGFYGHKSGQSCVAYRVTGPEPGIERLPLGPGDLRWRYVIRLSNGNILNCWEGEWIVIIDSGHPLAEATILSDHARKLIYGEGGKLW